MMGGSVWPPSARSASIVSTRDSRKERHLASIPRQRPRASTHASRRPSAFGDLDDPQSSVSELLARNASFRMHEELGTGPGFYYLWDRNVETTE